MRFPMLRGAVLVAIEQRRIGDVFAGRWTQTIDVGTDRIDGFENSIAPRVHEIASTGSADTKVNVAILGDGYQDSEYEKFTRDASRAASYLFSVQPFKKRARDFNVHAVFAASLDSGVTDRYLGVRKNTVLGCTYDSGEAERTLAAHNNRALRDVASAVPYDFLIVLANARRYGGSATFGGAAVVAIDSAAAPYLVLHEFAHAIGGLADEYYIPVAGGPSFVGNVEPWQPNVTISPARGKWPHLAQDPSPRPTSWNKSEYEAYFSNYVRRYFALRSAHADEQAVEKLMHQSAARTAALLAKNRDLRKVGWFEGANGYARGAFRSEVDCIMFSYQTQYFCRACSVAIERMIDAYC
ncbi:MAG: M64 family metallopeptidase [Burkholderiales bacterium]